MRNRSRIFQFASLAASMLTTTIGLEAASRPNIIFILCDDLGPGDIGVLWQNGLPASKRHQTPHLDRLASEGRVLNRHYTAAPVCAPARASLLTGQHQGHSGVRDNQFDKELPSVHTLGSVLQEAGYATSIIGKWGLQGDPSFPGHPLNRGFDFFFGYITHNDAHFHFPHESGRSFYENWMDISADLAKAYSTDLLTARAKKWIVDHHEAHENQPFFMLLAQVAPHAGIRVPTNSHLTATDNYPDGGGLSGGVQWLGEPGMVINTASGAIDSGIHPDYANATHNGTAWPNYAKRYATMVRRLDDSTADLIELLKDLGLDDNTLIVFTSDNGTQNAAGLDNVGIHDPRFFQTYGPYNGIKRDLWEGGIRMPTLVRWPAAIPAGTTSDEPSQFHDWMATFAELAGVPVPAFSDGRSIISHLTGNGTAAPGIQYVEYYEGGRTPNWTEFGVLQRNKVRSQMQAVYLGPYKGVRTSIGNNDTPFLIFDVVNNISESVNLAGQPGVPTQADFAAAALRLRRAGGGITRPYDSDPVPALADQPSVAGLSYIRFSGNYPWVPVFSHTDAVEVGVAANVASVPSGMSGEGALITGFLNIPTTGTYYFHLQSEGKAVIRLHNMLLIDGDSAFTVGLEMNSGPVVLQQGIHPITLSLLRGESSAPQLSWQGPGLTKTIIPDSAFTHATTNTPPFAPNRDLWAYQRTGNATTVIPQWYVDADRNGLNLVQEYTLGMKPYDPSGPLPKLELVHENNELLFSFPLKDELDGVEFIVEWSPGTGVLNWQEIPSDNYRYESRQDQERMVKVPVPWNAEGPVLVRLKIGLK